MVPAVLATERQDIAQEMVDVTTKLLGRSPLLKDLVRQQLRAAPVGLQDRLDVQLFLVAEMIIDRGIVHARPTADRPDLGAFESLLGELFARRLEQFGLGRIRGRRRHTPSPRMRHLFQTSVSINCKRIRARVNGRNRERPRAEIGLDRFDQSRCSRARQGSQTCERRTGGPGMRPVVVCVVGTRPEAIKMAPLILRLRRRGADLETRVVTSGQHRDLLDRRSMTSA